MKTLPTVNTLQPILHNQLPVITTELLAQLYGTERQRLTNNFNRNKERFIEGKHFFRIEGKELRELKNKNSLRVPVRVVNEPSLRGLQIPPKVRSLILWTERGAARHAKMLETNQAWDVFERLEDCYFNQNAQTAATVTVSPSNAREVVDTPNRCFTLRCAITSHSQPQPMLPKHSAPQTIPSLWPSMRYAFLAQLRRVISLKSNDRWKEATAK